MKTSTEVVERWARWSKQLWSSWADQHGPHVITDHDQAMERVRMYFRKTGRHPGEAEVVGLGAAADFVSSMQDLEPALKQRLAFRLSVQVGLLAEAVQNASDQAAFAALVGGFDQPPARASVSESEGAPIEGTFSCNAKGDVWRTPGFGLTPLAQRSNLKGQDSALDDIVRTVLAVKPAGGRFEVTKRGVFLADGSRQVA
jgi:hypothetical protein